MKRIIILIALIAILCLMVACGSETKTSKSKSAREEMDLPKDIMNVRTTSYKAKDNFGTIEKTEFESDWLIVFDKDGNSIEEYEFYENGKPSFKTWVEQRKYPEQGIGISEDGYLALSYKYEHDSNGNRLAHMVYDLEGKLNYKSINNYDLAGNLIERTDYSSDGSISGKTLYRYDSDQRLREYKRIGANGRQTERIEYLYEEQDAKGKPSENCSSSINYDENDSPVAHHEYRYNSQGYTIEEVISTNNATTTFETLYSYNRQGLWIKKTTKRNGIVTRVVEREFNVPISDTWKQLQKTITKKPEAPAKPQPEETEESW